MVVASAPSDKGGCILCGMRRGFGILLATLVLTGCGSGTQHASVRITPWHAVALALPAIPPAPTVKPVAYFFKTEKKHAAVAEDNGAASDTGIAPGAPTDAEVAAELKAAYGGKGGSAESLVDRAGLSGGLATIPPTAPPQVQAVISAANEVARYPYVYGGGHGTFEDTAYDCSGSLSFALAAAGMLHTTLVSGQFETWGAPGPGKWITIYANATHAWMTVAGLRYDTGGLLTSTHSRWQAAMRPTAGFVVRHPIGL
jgi:hypothetical protein